MKKFATMLFLLNTILWATYYAISKEALQRIDPIIFSFLELSILVPAALCILFFTRKRITREVLRRGVILGMWLGAAVFTTTIALKYTTATNTAFFPSLNGFLAALIAWVVLRQRISRGTWLAGVISVIGACLMIFESPTAGHWWGGDGIAFLGAFFYTCYLFRVDHDAGLEEDIARLPLFAVELLTMAVLGTIAALIFGDWHAFHPALPKDIWVVVYIGFATTFLPTIIATFMQRYVSPVTTSFIYILEPIWSALAAALYLGEVLGFRSYLGGACIIIGAVLNTWLSLRAEGRREEIAPTEAHDEEMMGEQIADTPAQVQERKH